MKKIIGFLKDYLTNVLKPWFLFSIMLFMACYVFIEYHYHCTEWLQTKFLNTITDLFIQYAVFLIPFTVGYLLYSIFYRDWSIWRKPLFWFLLLIAPFIFSLRSFINYFSDELYLLLPSGRTAYFYYRCTAVIIRDFIILIPVFIYWRFMDQDKMPLYGFTLKNYNTKPYLILLALMVPLVVSASYQTDFLNQYPKGFNLNPLSMDNPDEQKYFFIYELFYGFDFIFIEFFFRGFLLLAFYRHFGWGCLCPWLAFM